VLAAIAVARLLQLQLLRRQGNEFLVLPALARFSVGDAVLAAPWPSTDPLFAQ
jgi:hypothetical protein